MCEYEQLPLYKWYSTTDISGALPGLVCTPMVRKPPNTNWRDYLGWRRLLELVDGFPW